MPRKRLIRTSEYPYHVTTRCNNKEWFYVPIHDVYSKSVELLNSASKKFNLEVHAFVLMSNHYHLLISTPEENIDKIMQFFNFNLSLYINYKSQRINHVFGGRYFWTVIRSQRYYENVFRYIYQNPLRKNLVKDVYDYPYSTLNKDKYLKLYVNKNLYDREWLNEIKNEEVLNIKHALKKHEFKYRRNKNGFKS